MTMCPLTCQIVKEAIKAHEERGIVMAEYVDYHKECNASCLLCTRNEKSNAPIHLRSDKWIGGDTE